MKPILVDNWRHALKFKTVWVAMVITLMSVAQAEVLPLFEFAIPAPVFSWVTSVLAALVIVLRHFEMPEGLPVSWRLSSVQSSALLAALSVMQMQLLPLFQFAIPPGVYPWVTAVLGTMIIVTRLIAQPAVPGSGGTVVP